jgi:ribosomal protein L16 Arg81 hydroxylase
MEICKHDEKLPLQIRDNWEVTFKKYNGMALVLEANEIIFIPFGWWHHAINLSDTLAWRDSLINFSNIKQVILRFNENEEEFVSNGIDLKTLLNHMVNEAQSAEEIGCIFDALTLLTSIKWEKNVAAWKITLISKL